MQSLRVALQPFLERVKPLDVKQRIGLAMAGALLVGFAVWASAAATAPTYELLFANLDTADAAQIVERLRESRVPYRLEGGGAEILVPEQQVHDLRLTLAGEGLPSGGGVGFELFDQQRFGESEFSEQVKYHRALEGELARTVSHLSGVENARVHLVLPKQSLFDSINNSASASVALRLRPGARLSRDSTRGIVHLVASSVRGLSPENVTVVDGSGRRLLAGEDEGELAGSSLEFRQKYERGVERSIQQILDMAVGMGHGMVHVAADVSFTREELTEERVDPERVAARSFQIVEERDVTSAGTAGGVPGAVSTLEGSEANLTSDARNGMTRRSETRNFEISKTVRKAVAPMGRVMRLSIAVAVDGRWEGGGEQRKFTPRTEQELATIRNLVFTAAGADELRGDQVTVECVPFQEPESLPPEEAFDIGAFAKEYSRSLIGAGLGLLLLMVYALWSMIRRLKRRRRLSIQLERARPEVAVQPAGGESAPDAPAPPAEKALPEESAAEAERTRALSAEIATNDPYLAARVIRAWLTESAGAGASGKEEAA